MRIGEHQAVGDEAQIQASRGDAFGPAQQFGAHRWFAAAEDHHGITEAFGAVDLPFDAFGRVVHVANVGRMAEGAVFVAPVADFDEALHVRCILRRIVSCARRLIAWGANLRGYVGEVRSGHGSCTGQTHLARRRAGMTRAALALFVGK